MITLKHFDRSKVNWLAALLVMLVIGWLHWHFRGTAGGFWRDEVNLINLSQSHSLADMEKDSFPLFMPMLIHSWVGWGFGADNLRWLGCLIGCGVIGALCFASAKLRGSPPWFGLILFGLNSTLIVYGDSMRAYGLGCLTIILVVAMAGIFLRRPNWKNAIWLALVAILSVQTLFHNAILVAAICGSAALVCLRRRAWLNLAQVLGAGFVAALSLLPYIPNLIAGEHASDTLRTGLNNAQLLLAVEESFGFPVLKFCFVWLLLILTVLIGGGWRTFRSRPDTDPSVATKDLPLFAGATLILAMAGFYLFLKIAALPSESWYLLPLMGVLVCCLDLGWPDGHCLYCAAMTAVVVWGLILGVKITRHDLRYHYTNVDVWVAQLKTQAAPQDYILIVPWFCGITFQHYFTGANDWDTIPPIADHTTHRFDLAKAQLQNTNALAPIFQKMEATLQGGHRVWIMDQRGWMSRPQPGTTAPGPLPPPPLPNWGWSEVPYTSVWVSQISHYLGDHSGHFQQLKSLTAGEPIGEDMDLFVAEGWQVPAAGAVQPKQ